MIHGTRSRGLEPPTPCLQSDVYVRPRGADLAIRLSVSSRKIPQWTPVNGTLMARRTLPAATLSCLPLAIKPAVEEEAGVEVDRHAVSVPVERGEVRSRGRGPAWTKSGLT